MQRNSAQDGFMSQEVQQLDAKPQTEVNIALYRNIVIFFRFDNLISYISSFFLNINVYQ